MPASQTVMEWALVGDDLLCIRGNVGFPYSWGQFVTGNSQMLSISTAFILTIPHLKVHCVNISCLLN